MVIARSVAKAQNYRVHFFPTKQLHLLVLRIGIVGGLRLNPPVHVYRHPFFEWKSALNVNPWAKFLTFQQLTPSVLLGRFQHCSYYVLFKIRRIGFWRIGTEPSIPCRGSKLAECNWVVYSFQSFLFVSVINLKSAAFISAFISASTFLVKLSRGDNKRVSENVKCLPCFAVSSISMTVSRNSFCYVRLQGAT